MGFYHRMKLLLCCRCHCLSWNLILGITCLVVCFQTNAHTSLSHTNLLYLLGGIMHHFYLKCCPFRSSSEGKIEDLNLSLWLNLLDNVSRFLRWDWSSFLCHPHVQYSGHYPSCFLLKEGRSIRVLRIQVSQSIDFLLRCVPFSPQKAVASRREAPSPASLSPSLCSRWGCWKINLALQLFFHLLPHGLGPLP